MDTKLPAIKFQQENENKEEKKVPSQFDNETIFTTTHSKEEALEIQLFMYPTCQWPLVFEPDQPDAPYRVGGLTRGGGKLNKEEIRVIEDKILEYYSIKEEKGQKPDLIQTLSALDKDKFKQTIEALTTSSSSAAS